MRVEISYTKTVTEIITVPKEWEFYFKKDEDDYTNKEWDIIENKPFLNVPYEDIEVEREVK